MIIEDDDYVEPPIQPELGPPLSRKIRESSGTVIPERIGPIYEEETAGAA